jgi:lysine biosynthesis protein LysW
MVERGSSVVQRAACCRCGGEVVVAERVMVGEALDCPSCQAPLEVAELDPLVLERRARVEEDEAE